jgi:hypothetical protein
MKNILLIEQGITLNDKHTKTAHSQGRKFKVTGEQESMRLLIINFFLSGFDFLGLPTHIIIYLCHRGTMNTLLHKKFFIALFNSGFIIEQL